MNFKKYIDNCVMLLAAACLALPASGAAAQGNAPVLDGTGGNGKPGISYRYDATVGDPFHPYNEDPDLLNWPVAVEGDKDGNVWVGESSGARIQRFTGEGVYDNFALGHSGLGWYDMEDYIWGLRDFAVDSGGNTWVLDGTGLWQYSSSKVLLSKLVKYHELPEDDLTRMALDEPAGRLYLLNRNNSRVRVVTITGGTPVYHEEYTFGQNEAWNENDRFNGPTSMVLQAGKLYIGENNNEDPRILECNVTDLENVTCGVLLKASDYPDYPLGGELRASALAFGGGYLYIGLGDGLVRCDADGSNCEMFGPPDQDTLGNPVSESYGGLLNDISVIGGQVYVVDSRQARVLVMDDQGRFVRNIGVKNTPFTSSPGQMYAPGPLAIDNEGSMYLLENGLRLVKFNPQTQDIFWMVGEVGVGADGPGDNDHFSFTNSGGGASGVALDQQGRVYVSDNGLNRVQVFNAADGSHLATLGGTRGDGNYEFRNMADVAVGPNGDLYVVDRSNLRIQVYSWQGDPPELTWKATLHGPVDAPYFVNPVAVGVDQDNYLYVSDTGPDWENHRLLKCWLTGTEGGCEVLADVSVVGDNPGKVAIDSEGLVYVLGQGAGYVSVLDPNGDFRAQIGGDEGHPKIDPDTGEVSSASGDLWVSNGIAVDAQKNVYVSDTGNHRLQRFTRGVPDWTQLNLSGFGREVGRVSALKEFNGLLYAVASGWNGGRVYRLGSAGSWEPASAIGFDNPNNTAINGLAVYAGALYAATGNKTDGGQVWVSANGSDWSQACTSGFGESANTEVTRLAVYNGALLAGTKNAGGAQIWRFDGSGWSQASLAGAGDGEVTDFAGLNGYAYAAFSSGKIYRSVDGSAWDEVDLSAFSADVASVKALAAFGGKLYAGTGVDAHGARLYAGGCDPAGCVWSEAAPAGFGDTDNTAIAGLLDTGSALMAFTANRLTGVQVWSSADGVIWQKYLADDGFGSTINRGVAGSGAAAVFQGKLVAGLDSGGQFAQVWADEHTAQLLEPKNDFRTETASPTLQWAGNLDAADKPGERLDEAGIKYDLEIYSSASLAKRALVKRVSLSSLAYRPKLKSGKTYYWRVRQKGGPWSAVWTFTTPPRMTAARLLQPKNYGVRIGLQPTLTWRPAGSGVHHYQVQMFASRDLSPAGQVLDDYTLSTETQYTPVAFLQPNRTYYWRVRAWNTYYDTGPWSKVSRFSTAPETPLLISPAAGETAGSLTPAFNWTAGVNAPIKYEFQLSKAATFRRLVKRAVLTGTEITLTRPLAANTEYFWRVRAVGTGKGNTSGWSEVRSFTTPPTP